MAAYDWPPEDRLLPADTQRAAKSHVLTGMTGRLQRSFDGALRNRQAFLQSDSFLQCSIPVLKSPGTYRWSWNLGDKFPELWIDAQSSQSFWGETPLFRRVSPTINSLAHACLV